MTASEAIEKIDEVLESEYNFDETLGYQLTSNDFEWLEKAKQALEFRLPEKPIQSDFGVCLFRCPSCNDGLLDDSRCCPNCGQRLDWGDTE